MVIDHIAKPHYMQVLGRGKSTKLKDTKLCSVLSLIEMLLKPVQNIQGSGFDAWAVEMAEAAKHKNVFCKLSGLVNEVLQSIVYKC